MTRRRVAITGIGIVSPHGSDAEKMFGRLMLGESAVRHLELQSPGGSYAIVGAAVPEQDAGAIPREFRMTSDRLSQYALSAADSALINSGIKLNEVDLNRFGISVGTSLGGASSQEAAYGEIFRNRAQRLSPFTLIKVMYNGPAAQIAIRYKLAGPNLTYTTTCSSSTVSIGESLRQIRHGYADVMLAGGAEALFAFVSVKAWMALQVLAPELLSNPAATCRPFHSQRNGTVLGDGAAFVVLEDWGHAIARGAYIYGEAAGYGSCNDPSHLTQPSSEAQAMTMRSALTDADIDPATLDYLNAHGTGTRLNDAAEAHAIREVFGRRAQSLPVSSTKSMHGHLVGAAGALEFIISTLAVARNEAPPTAHLDSVDAECSLNHICQVGISTPIRAAMSNSFAVGGSAGALVVTSPS